MHKIILDELNIAEIYRNHISLTQRKSKSASHWDAQAEKSSVYCGNPEDPYLTEFLKCVDTQGAKTLLDIGCGPGTVSLPLAPQLEHVYALDYSAGMLEVVKTRSQAQGITNVSCIQRSWDDGVGLGGEAWSDVPQCDIVVCSRASMVSDIEDALLKINSKARLRAYMTMTVDPHLLPKEVEACLDQNQVGEKPARRVAFPNYIYAVNMLYQMGYLPKVSYIKAQECKGRELESNFDRFLRDIRWAVGEPTEAEAERLKAYYQTHYNLNQPLKPQHRTWAMVSWDL